MGQPANFNPKQIIMSFLNVQIQGYAEGTFCKVEKNEDAHKLYIGSDGEGAFCETNNESGTITFRLAATSKSNAFLSAAYNAKAGGVVQVKDLNGGSLFFSSYGKIKKFTPIEYSNEITSNEWVIEAASLLSNALGN